MATRRGEKASLLELKEQGQTTQVKPSFRPFRRANEYIERTVLPTDTLQGISLLYNTTVAEIKKLNHLQTDGELHARRVIKVPSRGVLINLEPVPTTSKTVNEAQRSAFSVDDRYAYDVDDDPDTSASGSSRESLAGMSYLNTKDTLLTEIKAKVDHVASNSPILQNEGQGIEDLEFSPIRKGVRGSLVDRQNESPLKWWHVLFPCMGFVILFPILLFIFQEHLHDLGHKHDNDHLMSASTSSMLPSSGSEYLMSNINQ